MSIRNMLTNVDLSLVKRDYAWYTVTTLFNCEESYVRNLKDAVRGHDLSQYMKEYYIPIQYEKTEDGKVRKRKGDFSRYVFVKCILTSKVWNVLRTTAGAAVVLTTGGVPVEISDEEIQEIRRQTAPIGFTEEEENELRRKLLTENRCKGFKKPKLRDADFDTDFVA